MKKMVPGDNRFIISRYLITGFDTFISGTGQFVVGNRNRCACDMSEEIKELML